jgi:aspartyl-tRNA(Asn)/glutamyl-tRNA(Gln) amidotransferase subunit A
VPFTIKDCVDTAGVRTTRGSRLFEDRVPDVDAPVVTRLKEAGGVLMGKTNMPEFALWGETDNDVFGRTVNPWNVDRTAGGSSGGEGAAIAAGLSPLGVGSDVGGSIRGPAQHCGIVGLKATHGRVPLTGHWPETMLRLMHVGPMARTVRDIALELSIIAGADGFDSYAVPVPPPGAGDMNVSLAGLRVGWNSGEAFGPVDPEVSAVVARAAAALAEAGCSVEEVSLPGLSSRDLIFISVTGLASEGAHYVAPIVAGREDELSPNMKRNMALPTPTLRQVLEAREGQEGIRQDMAAYFGQYHLLLCPTTLTPAHPHNATDVVIGGKKVTSRMVGNTTRVWDWTGSPAVSVPFGWSSEGLPIGAQIVGRHLDEATVLSAAAALEALHDATTKRPPV